MARVTPSQFERSKYKVEGQWCLLYGPDDYRKQEALEGLLRRIASAEGALFEPVTLDGEGLSAARVLESAQTPSLFGPAVIARCGCHARMTRHFCHGCDIRPGFQQVTDKSSAKIVW